MDESVAEVLRKLDARRTILKHEITVQRDKLNKIKTRIFSDAQFYVEIERKLKALYDEDERTADDIAKFKLRNALD